MEDARCYIDHTRNNRCKFYVASCVVINSLDHSGVILLNAFKVLCTCLSSCISHGSFRQYLVVRSHSVLAKGYKMMITGNK